MAATQSIQKKEYVRFAPTQRLEHIILLVTFTGLALTGLPQKYGEQAWAQAMIQAMGGIESVRVVHRFLATLMMAETIFHGGVLSYKIFVLGRRATMIPTLKDGWDVLNWITYNLGLRKNNPEMPRYNFGEKAEYLAVVWGTIAMIGTGFMMWNPIATTKFVPGVAIPAARAAHGAEAVLAVLSIVIWHMYNVHLKHFNRSMFTGKLSAEAMHEEHGEELASIQKGEVPVDPPADVLAKRKRLFWPYAAVMTIVLSAGLLWFITFEDSAIQTVPANDVVVFAPQVTETAGDAAVGKAIWPTLRCGFCHGEDGTGLKEVPSLRGTDVSFEKFFAQVRNGDGNKMPAFNRGEIPDSYLLHLWMWLKEKPTS